MNPRVMVVAARSLTPLLLLLALVLLARGHHEPGGGFAGGLVAAAAVLFSALAFGTEAMRRRLVLNPLQISAVGLAIALASGLIGPAFGLAPLEGVWWSSVVIPGVGKLGTPLIFDIGVFLVVVGVASAILLELLAHVSPEEGEDER